MARRICTIFYIGLYTSKLFINFNQKRVYGVSGAYKCTDKTVVSHTYKRYLFRNKNVRQDKSLFSYLYCISLIKKTCVYKQLCENMLTMVVTERSNSVKVSYFHNLNVCVRFDYF